MLDSMLLAAALVLHAVTAQEAPASNHRLLAELGFSHWFGSTFGNPDGINTPSLTVGGRPGLEFLEVRVRYSISVRELAVPAGQAHVGFASLEVGATREFRRGNQVASLALGLLGLIDHGGPGAGEGYGVWLEAQYLFQVGERLAIGGFCTMRGVYYQLPGEHRDLFGDPRRDAQIDLGVAVTFF